MAIEAARSRGEALDHVLLFGPPGVGKTSLAHVIAAELDVPIKATAGPIIERAGDLAALLTALDHREILFVDEIHRLDAKVEEILYPALEDYSLDLMIGTGPGARSMKIPLKPFTLVGRHHPGRAAHRAPCAAASGSSTVSTSTPRPTSSDHHALGATSWASPSSRRGRGRSPGAAAARPASRTGSSAASATSPRSAPTASSPPTWPATPSPCSRSTSTASTRSTASCSSRSSTSSAGGPVGVGAIAAAISEEPDAIEDIYEPYLLQIGFLDRTPRGRIATRRAYEHFGRLPPEGTPGQKKLF